MSYTLVQQCLAQPLPPARRAVLLVLADMANATGTCWPSTATIASRACMSVRSVFNHLAALVRDGLLVRRPRQGRSTVYSLRGGIHANQPAPAEPISTPTQPASAPTHQKAVQETEAAKPGPSLSVVGVVEAMRSAGLQGTYNPQTVADLLQAPSTLSEFTEAAAEAVKRGNGFAWALARVAGKRKDTSMGIQAAPMRLADVARVTVPSRFRRDPILQQIEEAAAHAKPPSTSMRMRLAQLRAAFAAGPSASGCGATVR